MLTYSDVSVSYGAIQALQSLMLEVKKGSFTVLLGANGAGKTTLIRALAGLVPVRGGAIYFEGKALLCPTERRCRQGIAFVPEGRQLWPGMTVAEHLTLAAYPQMGGWRKFGKRLSPDVRRVVEDLLDRFPALQRNYSHRVETMSGGEQQMLALARALIMQPKLIALDEPTVGLAPNLASELFIQLKRLVDEGLTVLLVEQNADAALSVADYGYVLEYGRVVAHGDPETLRSSSVLQEAYLGAKGA